jgi:hypothetical protein
MQKRAGTVEHRCSGKFEPISKIPDAEDRTRKGQLQGIAEAMF